MMNSSLPFTDANVWDYLRWHSYLSAQHMLLYVATPKVACTSLQWWFAALEGCSDALLHFTGSSESAPELIIHDGFRQVAPQVTGLTPDALIGPLTSNAYFRFAVVRNPFARIFSAWQSKILLREPLQVGPYTQYDFFSMPIESAADMARAFERFLEHLASYEAPNFLDIHCTPQVALLRPDLIAYSELAQIEDVSSLTLALAEHLGGDVPDPFAGRRANMSLIPYLPRFVTDRSASLIRSLYAQDFAAFGYAESPPDALIKFSDSQVEVALQAIGLLRARHQRLSEVRAVFEEHVERSKNTIADHEHQIDDLNAKVSERDVQIASLAGAIRERDDDLAALQKTMIQREAEITRLGQAIVDRDARLASLNGLIDRQQAQIAALGSALENTLPNRLRKSLNAFLRRLLAIAARLLPVRNEAAYGALRSLYRRLPISLESKMPWAQHLLADVPELQAIAYRLERNQPGAPSSLTSGSPGGSPASHRASERRILVVEHRLPTPDRNSSSVRLFAMLKLIAGLGWQITFVSSRRKPDYQWLLSDVDAELPRYEQALSALGVDCLYGMETLVQHLKEQGSRYRLALLSYPEIMHQVAPWVRAFMPDARLVYDTVDLHGLRLAREAASRNNDPSLLERSNYYWQIELAGAECADSVVAVTDAERDELLQRVPGASVQVIPNIHSVSASPPGLPGREGLLFIGHYAHSPNGDAVTWFIREVLPLIQEQIPGLPFYALGSSMTQDLKQFGSTLVHMIGYVEDPAPWFARARVFVAPLRYGAGMKGKIGQSLSLGLPVVTTSIGAEGMLLEEGVTALIADGAPAFADAVVRLYRDDALWQALAKEGRAHVERHFSESAAREALAHLLEPEAQTAAPRSGS